jgi:hypothetical protein
MASAKALVDQPLNLPAFQVAGLTESQQNLINQGIQGIGAYQPLLTQAQQNLQQSMDAARSANIADVANVGASNVAAPSLATAQTNYAPNLQQQRMGPVSDVTSREVQGERVSAAQSSFAPNLQNFQMGPTQQVTAERVGQGIGGLEAAQTGFRPDLQAFQMGPAERVQTGSFVAPGTAESYMSPYIQNVLQSQIAEARRSDEIARQGRAAQAVAAGAFGGTRQAVQESEAARNLARLEADIMAQGLQGAYATAQQQFNAEQQARLAAQQANQAAGLTVGQQNLAAQLGTQELGTQAGLQTALANLSAEQQARVTNQAIMLQAQGMNQDAALRAALSNQQTEFGRQQQNLAAQLGVQELGTQTGLQNALANLSAEQQARVANQANALQAQGMNQEAALRSALANQQTEFNTQQQNLAAGLSVQELGANIGLQTSLANLSAEQQANVQQAALALQASGMNQDAALRAALSNQQTQAQLATARGELGLQSAQLQGQQALGQADLANLGQNLSQQSTQFGIGLGEIQRGINQQVLDATRNTAMQNTMAPYQQLGFYSDIVRGTPSAQSTITATTAPQPSTAQQIAGLATTAVTGAAAANSLSRGIGSLS